MRLIGSVSRIGRFFYRRRRELFDVAFWHTVVRVVRSRFNFWDRVSNQEFIENLRAMEQRPWNLHIELTNSCTANCIFCAYQYQKRPLTVMSDEIYRKALVDYCAMGGGDLMLECVVGDPAVDPQFIDRISLARSCPEIARIETITNGIAIKESKVLDLIKSGISKIQISSGPFRQDLYVSIYRTKSYEKMLRNVRALLEANKESGCPVEITIAFRSNLTMKDTLALPDYLQISHLPHSVEFNTDFDTWRGRITSSDLLPGMHVRPKGSLPDGEPCFWLYDGPIIFSDGRIGLCGCRDFDANSDLIVGHIMEESLLDAWRSDRVKGLRRRFKVPGDFPDICKDCTSVSGLEVYRRRLGSHRAMLTLQRLNASIDYAGVQGGKKEWKIV